MYSLLVSALLVGVTVFAAEAPKGFEDPSLLQRVLGGEIVQVKQIDTALESKVVVKSFFRKVSTDAFIDLAIRYDYYAEMFDEVKSGELISVSPDKSQYRYKLDVVAKVGLLQQHVYPQAMHTLERATSVHSEARLTNELTNYQENVEIGTQWVRLIPYQDGILVEDVVHVKAAKGQAFAKIAKQKFLEFFLSYTEIFRDELNG